MITEIRQSRRHLLHSYERHSRRRYHTLDNSTLDKFNFICVPLNLDEPRIDSSSSQSNIIITPSNEFSLSKSTELASPTRRVRFKCDENQRIHSSDDIQVPKKYSIHRVEFQIPIHKNINSYFKVDCSSIPPKTRSITSKKIDINYNNTIHLPGMSSIIDSPTLSTTDSDKTQTQWYKEMYGQIHKSPESKKDVILVKLPPTHSRYREYYQQRDKQQNPYKITYTFPEELDGNLERMEAFIRKAASQNIDDDDDNNNKIENIPSSTTNVKDHEIISRRTRLDNQLSSPITSSSTERTKSNHDASPSSRSNPTHIRTSSSTTDDEQKSAYKRILRGGDIPSAGLQKLSINNRENQSSNLNDDDIHFEINSCLYFQNDNHDDDEWEQIREDGCGYVITYPPHIDPAYNFDRTKNFLLTSHDVYLNSKKDYNYFINKSEKE